MLPGGFPDDLDLANPGANAALLGMLETMGLALPSGDAVKGKTEMSLDLDTNFIGRLITLGEGTTDIKLTVKDAAGHAASETLKITIVDDLKVEITGAVGGDPIDIKMSDALADPIAIDPVAVDVVAPQGIETFVVEIDSSSDAFMAGLAEMHFPATFDIANPGTELGGILTGVGMKNGDDVKGKTEVEFEITNFIPMIFGVRAAAGESGGCTADFKLTVTDTKGTTKEATIALSLIDDSAAE